MGKPFCGSPGLLLPIVWPLTTDCAVGPQFETQLSASALVGMALEAPVEMPWEKSCEADIKKFHDAVLKNGAVPLSVLRKLLKS